MYNRYAKSAKESIMELYPLVEDDKSLMLITNNTAKEIIMNPEVTFTSFVRKPFCVEAVQITAENIGSLATLLGELKEKDGEVSILIDRRIIPNIKKAYIGWWVTKLDDNLRCYSPKVFEKEFTSIDDGWFAYFAEPVPAEELA